MTDDAGVHLKALAEAEPYPYWFDDRDEPIACAALIGTITADLCVVGGGYTGLWTAIGAKRRNPSLDVVLLEGDTVGWGGSGRNGGFMESSLTHGLANGQQRFPERASSARGAGSGQSRRDRSHHPGRGHRL